MSSLKRLNHSIKLKRMQGNVSARQSELSINLLLHSVKKQTEKHPFGVTAVVSIVTFIFAKYRRNSKPLNIATHYFNLAMF
jgi:hypothetical protein